MLANLDYIDFGESFETFLELAEATRSFKKFYDVLEGEREGSKLLMAVIFTNPPLAVKMLVNEKELTELVKPLEHRGFIKVKFAWKGEI
jgi:hypothetical protein